MSGVRVILESTELYEREAELEASTRQLDAAEGGEGAAIRIEGEAGIGKTCLLAEIGARARDRGFVVASARGVELEREFPFGIVRQLLEPVVRRLPAEARTEVFAGAARFAASILDSGRDSAGADRAPAATNFAILHGLYWACVNLSDRAPLMLAVDDAHWADDSSLRFLDHLGRRLDGVAIAIVLATRTGEASAAPVGDPLGRLAMTTLSPSPLSTDAVRRLASSRLAAEATPGFADACERATNGNPFFVVALCGSLAADGIAPTDENAARLAEMGPRAIADFTLARLAHLGPTAPPLARAAATLGEGAELRHAARLAGLASDEAGRCADALVEVGILDSSDPVRFVHPIVPEAIRAERGLAELSIEHRAAAELLAADGAPAERVCEHLLQAATDGDVWVVSELRRAAAESMVRGAPAEATAYLRRALREPPAPDARPKVLRELGHAEGLRSDPAALAHLEAAIAETGEPRARAPVALELAQLLVFAGRPADARELLAREREEASGAGDGELQLRLTAALVGPTVFDLGWSAAGAWLDDLRAGLAADDDPVALACLAIEAATAGRSADETAALAERALAGDGLLREVTSDSQSYSQAWSALFVADRLDEATAALGAGLAEARERGSALGFVTASGFQAHVDYRAGRLHEGMANAQAALDVERLEGQSVEMIAAYARGFLVDLAVEMGELQLADRVIDDAALGGALPEQAPFDHLRHARGGLRFAQGRLQEAADDLLEAGRIFLGLGIPNPSWAPWRSNAALAQARLGNRDQASQLLAEELELARRFGAPRAIGIALRAAGLCAKGAAEIELLRESEAVLRRSPARLEHAKSSVELGAALRRHRSRREAREPLRAGLEFAERSGAAPLAERAREELAATGARPRRIVRSGTESLTASERRVATMAADGMSNPEIAQALFVTRRTVETHLTAVYRKLEISSRSELSGALAS